MATILIIINKKWKQEKQYLTNFLNTKLELKSEKIELSVVDDVRDAVTRGRNDKKSYKVI